MKKLKLLSLLMLICFSVGNVWADDPASVGTTLFSEDFSSYSANNVPSGSVTTATGRVVYGGLINLSGSLRFYSLSSICIKAYFFH